MNKVAIKISQGSVVTLRLIKSKDTFKRHLKTHCFKLAFLD